MHSFAAMAIVGVLWVACGYALCFGTSMCRWLGWNPDYLFLRGIDGTIMTTGIPEYAFAMFQGTFAIITPAPITGAFAERIRSRGYCLFIALGSLLVCCPLCHVVWGGGFLTGKAIDFAGVTVIHISAGVAGLVCALSFGARRLGSTGLDDHRVRSPAESHGARYGLGHPFRPECLRIRTEESGGHAI